MAERVRTLPGTGTLAGPGDYGRLMLRGLSDLLDKELAAADEERQALLRKPGTAEEVKAAMAERRQQLARSAGVVDARIPGASLEPVGDVDGSALLASTATHDILAVRWPVLSGVDGEGLLLRPRAEPVATAIAIPDADCPPEMLAGILPRLPPAARFAWRLVELGCQVLVPALVDRDCRWSGNPDIRLTNQPHREFVYRMAYQMGRHIIGYEVQKVLALVDLLQGRSHPRPLLVFGYGEGGLLALYSAALDERIDAVGVSGYFANRYGVWQEPIYRNVWRLLRGCSDAELGACIAPRPLLIEASAGPGVDGPPPATRQRSGAAPGVLCPVAPSQVRAEVELLMPTYGSLAAPANLRFIVPEPDEGPGCPAALTWLLQVCGAVIAQVAAPPPPPTRRPELPAQRQQRQVAQLVAYTQQLWHGSAKRRREFWQHADSSSVTAWQQTTAHYRRVFQEEIIGPAPPVAPPGEAQSRLLETTSTYELYEVVLDVWPGVPAFAYLLVPDKATAATPHPVVVCQHGLGGSPRALLQSQGYRSLARALASHGYVALAPLNPYIGPAGDSFRVLQRKANPLGCSLFSFVTAIHRQWLAWLASQPYADTTRVALYGLSYGGKTALRVPALLEGYTMSICSGDFNEWVMKTVSVDFPTSYMFAGEYEMPEFNLANTFNHAEMACLIAPRPFMVERGHDDPCSEDEWVAGEYAKVRRLYGKLGLGQNTDIEFFCGGHEINLQGTLRFLDRHLGHEESL